MEQAVLEKPAQAKKRFTFQVLAGKHWEPGIVEDEMGRQVVRDIKYGPHCPAGDIVETDIDLARLHNRPNSIKFKRVGTDGQLDAQAEELKVEKQRAVHAQTGLRSALEKMPRNELVAWAEEQEIDLRGATKREDVLRQVLATLG